ncbi:zinc-binding alcohol dehydrogenase family protein [Streptomyces sp. NPDC060209]|uniref:quinone oxidoreductase family protein n=1 Tax=Streptomyces sp. NPDC060209 TaxID=3347073 RepID=UPI003664B4AC
MSHTMTALLGGAGPDWVTREVSVPEPGPGQVLVRTRAVSLGNADVQMLASADSASGSGNEYVAGYEFAGEIAAVGTDTGLVQVGNHVMGASPGAFAEYVLADHRHVMPIPGSIGHEKASALPTALFTEHGALALASFQAGQSVLITGATSGIGLVGVQIAKALGARTVLATTRTDARSGLVKTTGADVVIATTSQNLTKMVLEATDGQGVDAVLDHVGGQTLADCLPATRVDGTILNIGRLDQAASTIDLDALSYRHLRLLGVSYGFSRAAELGGVIAGLTPHVLPAVADGRIRPVIDTVFPLAQAKEAADRMRTNQAQGKVVLVMP